MPTRVAVFVHRGVSAGLALLLPMIFEAGNRLLGFKRYGVFLLDANGSKQARRGIATIALSPERGPFDFIIVPPIDYLRGRFAPSDSESNFLKNHRSSVIASACLGAFLLASAGLLNGREATTHWNWIRLARRMFPDVHWNDRAMICDAGPVITSGGVLATVDLALYLLAKTESKELSHEVGRHVLADSTRQRQSIYAQSLVPQCESAAMQDVARWIDEHLHEPLTVSDLSRENFMSVRNFHRTFLKAFGISPNKYIQLRRIERAKELLKEHDIGMKEVLAQIGISDATSFRRIFERELGLTPSAYRNRLRQT